MLVPVWFVAFIALYLFDHYNLKREGVYPPDEPFPLWDLVLIFLVAIIGVPAVLIKRCAALRVYRESGGPELSVRHAFFNWYYVIMLVLIIPITACCWWDAKMHPELYQ
ncbi:MAG: hypothetical protein JSW52_10540 [Candidatus Coatesbacteria bacterium]|nr:MAG: hypothetical protein JSW52_10540 [Candidatus Coatesbacteria bacterium]